MRTIRNCHIAPLELMGTLTTYTAIPNKRMTHLDPFILLNHHGPQEFHPGNEGLPFGPHPHRGFETLTFILQGDVMHKDSIGNSSIITSGGIQWMTAGSGIVHTETSSPGFMQTGGTSEVIQLWINLPARLKMTPPRYHGHQWDTIPVVSLDDDMIRIQVVSGEWNGIRGAVESLTDINMFHITMDADSSLTTEINADRSVLLYVVRGAVSVNDTNVPAHGLVEFVNDGETIQLTAKEDSIIILGHGLPYYEPIVSHGPFVMNNSDEISEAIYDFRTGKMGEIPAL